MTHQSKLANLAQTHADHIAETITHITTSGMTVTVTVHHAGQQVAEGFATTDDYAQFAQPLKYDPDR